MIASLKSTTPVGRIGRPADIAGMAVHLSGIHGAFITGQVSAMDGGWTAQ